MPIRRRNMPKNNPLVTGKYVPERLVDFKVEDGQKFYLVKWCGFPHEDNSWEPGYTLRCHYMKYQIEQEKNILNPKPIVPVILRTIKADSIVYVPFDDRITGFDLGYKPDTILGFTVVNGDYEFLVQWKDVDDPDFIPREIANERLPQMVINFYQRNLMWKNPGACFGPY